MAHEDSNMTGPSSNKFFDYDVFLNHRGPDTKEQFLVPLVQKLQDAGIQRPFLDRREVHHGEDIFKAIEAALASARIHIAFFSRNYAHSTYCLSELHEMLGTGRPIITVFYDVRPDHVRRPRNMHGPYAEAFKIHEAREKPDVVQNWATALEKAAAIRGFVRASDG
jgi:hypothetical protein